MILLNITVRVGTNIHYFIILLHISFYAIMFIFNLLIVL